MGGEATRELHTIAVRDVREARTDVEGREGGTDGWDARQESTGREGGCERGRQWIVNHARILRGVARDWRSQRVIHPYRLLRGRFSGNDTVLQRWHKV